MAQILPFNFSPLLQVDGKQISISLDDKNADYAKENALTWTVEALNVITGENVYTGTIEGYKGIIDATRWKSGVYVLKSRIGDSVIVQKIAVK